MAELHDNQDNVLAAETTDRRIVESPIEVHERIIGSLDNYFCAGTIARCALVRRAWLPFSRYKLYFAVRLKYRRQWTAFERLMSSSTSASIVE